MGRSAFEPKQIPWVVANFAITWDGRISTRNRTPSDFSSAEDKRRLLQIRAEGDAVMASAATVAADTMTMGLPDAGMRARRVAGGLAEFPLRVLVTQSGGIRTDLRLFSEGSAPVVVFSTQRMPDPVREALRGRVVLELAEGETLDLGWVLGRLWSEFGVRKLVFEGGGTLLKSLLRGGYVQEMCLTLCPTVFGGESGVSLTGAASEWLPHSVRAHCTQMEVVGGECFTRWRVGR